MNERHRHVLLKIATNPGFLDHAQNWAGSLFDGKQGTSMPHFNEMMKSEWAKDFSKSFNSFTNNVGNFVDSMSDDTPGSTTTAFANLYKGPGAPWAWTATALAMSSAFNSPPRGNPNSGGGGVSGIVPWLALGALGFGAYKAWPTIKNLLAAEKNTRGWRAYQADPDNPDNGKKAIDDTVRLRRNKREAQKTAEGEKLF